MGGDQSSAQQVAREKEGINQGWPRKESADHKKKRVMKTSTEAGRRRRCQRKMRKESADHQKSPRDYKRKESPAWDHEKSLRTKMRRLVLMLAMIQVQQDELAFDDDVDEN